MNHRPLGSTGLSVSEMGFGCGNVGGLMIKGTPGDRVRAVGRAIKLGINYFDTAPEYGDGLSEIHLGQALKELRAEVHVGTKFRLGPGDLLDIKGAVLRSTEESLKRLDRDYVDLIQLHNHITHERGVAQVSLSLGMEDLLGEVMGALQSLQAQGKASYYGITGLGETRALHQVIDAGVLHTVQACYNLLNPSAGERVPAGFNAQDFGRLIGRASEKGMGVIVIRALAAGALSGAEERHPIAVHRVAPIASGRDYMEDVVRARSFNILIAEGHVEGLIEASIRFALSNETVSTVLVGYSSLEQLERAVEHASRGALPPEAFTRLSEVWSRFEEI